jgi:carboxypeptidase C (cathepsin A)
MGNKAWTMALEWSGRAALHATGDHEWYYPANVDGTSASTLGGWVRSGKAPRSESGVLTFMQVKEAGHMVPMDQPQAALAMLNTFTAHKAFY